MSLRLDDQFCSLEFAKRLKELGCLQESLFYWARPKLRTSEVSISLFIKDHYIPTPMYPYRGDYRLFGEEYKFCMNDMIEIYSAYTVAELGELLPQTIRVSKERLLSTYDRNGDLYTIKLLGGGQDDKCWYEWVIGYKNEDYEKQTQERIVPAMLQRTEAEARGKALIYLLENNLMQLPKEPK